MIELAHAGKVVNVYNDDYDCDNCDLNYDDCDSSIMFDV